MSVTLVYGGTFDPVHIGHITMACEGVVGGAVLKLERRWPEPGDAGGYVQGTVLNGYSVTD